MCALPLSGLCLVFVVVVVQQGEQDNQGRAGQGSKQVSRAGRAKSSWRVIRADEWMSSTAEWDNACQEGNAEDWTVITKNQVGPLKWRRRRRRWRRGGCFGALVAAGG